MATSIILATISYDQINQIWQLPIQDHMNLICNQQMPFFSNFQNTFLSTMQPVPAIFCMVLGGSISQAINVICECGIYWLKE
jgi:hypothetical protein